MGKLNVMNQFSKTTYTERRQRLKQEMSNGVLLFLGNEESSMNFKDNWYPFRQDSSFLYFFGLDKPGLVALIDIEKDREIVFGDEISIEDSIWHGPKPSLVELADSAGVYDVRPKDAIVEYLAVLKGKHIHFLPPYRPENTCKIAEWLQLRVKDVSKQVSGTFIKAVVKQRSIKTQEELDEISKAVNISVGMHLMAMEKAKAGMREYEVVGMVTGQALRKGCSLSFPPIITVKGHILHNHYYGNKLSNGDMLLADFGAETAMHYAGDITRTFPVGTQFSNQQREVYQIVRNAHKAAIAALKPGIKFFDVHILACKELVEGLKEIGLMQGDAGDAVREGAHTLFFQCGLGHMMGLDVHDMEDLGEAYVGYTPSFKQSKEFGFKSLRLGRELERGFVVTIEPGLYFIPELIAQWKAKRHLQAFINYDQLEKYAGFGGIRIEDAFQITSSGSELLGNPLPTEVHEVEEVRN